jgi:hypothetical protein
MMAKRGRIGGQPPSSGAGQTGMEQRTRILVITAVAVLLVVPPGVSAQARGWRPGNRSLTTAEEREAAAKARTIPFRPRDLSGVWGLGTNGFNLDQRTVPPMTSAGKEKYDAAKPGLGPRGVPLGNDPLMICDPLGYPRSFTYNYGMEFIETPGRMLQFFEWGHTWRTIWTDGRPLPTDVDEPRWYGYAVGRWDGDTFVVESTGFDERSWLDQDGHPHSGAMRLVERYRRTAADAMEVTITLTDPETYTQPWVTKTTLRLNPLAEIGEYFCVPSDEEVFRQKMREPAGGARP